MHMRTTYAGVTLEQQDTKLSHQQTLDESHLPEEDVRLMFTVDSNYKDALAITVRKIIRNFR